MVTDTLIMSRVANATVYVCRADYSYKSDFGLINELKKDGYGKRYGYGYGYGYGEKQKEKKEIIKNL